MTNGEIHVAHATAKNFFI